MNSFLHPSRRLRSISIALVSLIVALGAASVLAKNKSSKPAKPAKIDTAADSLFAGTDVPSIAIELPAADLETLKKYQWNFGPQQDREKVKATLREDGHVYTNVALQLKGAAGSFRSIDDKPAFTLNFDKFADGQTFHGLR